MARVILPGMVALLLCACQTSYRGNVDSPYYLVPVGSTLVQNQDVVIPPHRAGVFMQGGRVLPLSQVNQYYPYCKFEVLTLGDSARIVRPDAYVIKKVVQEIAPSVDAGLIRLAALSVGIGIHAGMDDGASMETYATRLYLRSDKQPDVYRLSCGLWAYPATGRHVTLREMRAVLGEVFTLRLAPTPP